MANAGRGAASESATRTALLDAAEAIMVEEGYAAVTTRRLAQRVGVNNGLVTYYFGTMDGLIIELFHRGTGWSLEQLDLALQAPQPLWAMWRLIQDFSASAFTAEFTAMAKHRPVVRDEMGAYLRTFRTRQLAGLEPIIESYEASAERWPPVTLIFAMSSIAIYMNVEQAFGVDIGHAATVEAIEREIEALEGAPKIAAAKRSRRRSAKRP